MDSRDRSFQEILQNSEIIWVTSFSVDDAILFQEHLMEQVRRDPYKPVVINISSPGGAVDGLFSMLDSMDAARALSDNAYFSIITVATGQCMSAGAVLLSHGDLRFATPNSRIMLHQVNAGTYGSMPDIDVEYAEIVRLNEKTLTILAANCNYKGTMPKFRELLHRDKYLSAEQAVKFGLVDYVGYPKIMQKHFYELAIATPKGLVFPESLERSIHELETEILAEEKPSEQNRRTNKKAPKKKAKN